MEDGGVVLGHGVGVLLGVLVGVVLSVLREDPLGIHGVGHGAKVWPTLTLVYQVYTVAVTHQGAWLFKSACQRLTVDTTAKDKPANRRPQVCT